MTDCGNHFGAHQALPVSDGEPDWDSGSPKTADEYLKRVRWEAASCDQIARSDIDVRQFDNQRTEYIPKVASVADAPSFCQPTTAWTLDTLRDFHRLRQHFERLDMEEDGEVTIGMPIFINNQAANAGQTDSELELQCIEDNIVPDMTIITSLDQVKALRRLRAHIASFLQISDDEAVSDVRCFWLYALMTRIHCPLHDTTAAAIRSLFKRCSEFRAMYAQRQIAFGNGEDVSLLPRLNLLHVICGIYFGQDEKMTGIIHPEQFQY